MYYLKSFGDKKWIVFHYCGSSINKILFEKFLNRYNYDLGVLMILVLFLFSCTNKFPDNQIFLWTTTEWSINNQSVNTNVFDVEGTAHFKNLNTGTSVKTPLFYSEEGNWKFRFTPTEKGTWTFFTSSVSKNLNGWKGKVNVIENPDREAHGFIKNFGSKWGWQGTDRAFIPQYVMAKDLRLYYDNDSVDINAIEADIQEFIVEHGFTGFHIAMGGDWFAGENPDTRIYSVLETIIVRVHQLGGACHLWLWGSNTKALDGPPMNEKDQRNLRYLAARLGPLPGWSMGYGFDVENGWASVEQLNDWKNFLESHIGWKHFLGARVGYDEKGLFAVSPRPPRPPHDESFCAPIADEYCTWLEGDYIGYTSYRPLYDRYSEAITHHPEKPSFEEDRFRVRKIQRWKYKDYDEELTRRGLWHSAMAGGIANIWGNFLPHEEKDYEVLNSMGSKPYQNKAQIKTYSLFFKNRFLKAYKSKKNPIHYFLLSSNSKHAIIYAEDTIDVILHEVKDFFINEPIIAVDTKKEYYELKIDLKNNNTVWQAPYESDWAIAVGDFTVFE